MTHPSFDREVFHGVKPESDGEYLIVAAGDQCDARDAGIECLSHRQALDVEAATAEQAGNACQHAELVLHQH